VTGRVCIRLHTGEIFEDRIETSHQTYVVLARRGRVDRDQIAALATYTPKTGD
jgi:hypothetical protein